MHESHGLPAAVSAGIAMQSVPLDLLIAVSVGVPSRMAEAECRERLRRMAIDKIDTIFLLLDSDTAMTDAGVAADLVAALTEDAGFVAMNTHRKRVAATDEAHVNIGCCAISRALLLRGEFRSAHGSCCCSTLTADAKALGYRPRYLEIAPGRAVQERR
jgi:hypothetical protein